MAQALSWSAILAYLERDPTEVDRFASEVIELSTGAEETQIEASLQAAPQGSRSQFRYRHAPKRATQNTAAKKQRVRRADRPGQYFPSERVRWSK
jgi:hypothetical protein